MARPIRLVKQDAGRAPMNVAQPSITGLPGFAMYGHHEGEGTARVRPGSEEADEKTRSRYGDWWPGGLERGVEANAACGNLFDSQLDWAWMMLVLLDERFFALRSHPHEPVELYDIFEDAGCDNNLAADHPDLVRRAQSRFVSEHQAHPWYTRLTKALQEARNNPSR